MKSALIIILAMLLIVSFNVAASESGITTEKIDDMVYQFDFTQENATEYRWAFGDGATSTEINPVHQYQNHMVFSVVCEVNLGNGTLVNSQINLDATLPFVDDNTGTVNVGDVSVPGGLLFMSSFFMFALASTGNHIGSDILGRGGKDVMCFLYTLGMVVGAYLVLNSLYGGV